MALQIQVQQMHGETITLEVLPDTTVKELKKELTNQHLFEDETLRKVSHTEVILGDRKLMDQETLADAEISSETPLQVVFTIHPIECCSLPDGPAVPVVHIPTSVTSIEAGAFESCQSLLWVSIPSSVTTIGSRAFNRCKSLEKVTMSCSVIRVDDGAFQDCCNLAQLELAAVEDVGDRALQGSGLRKMRLPRSLRNLGADVFRNCRCLEELSFPTLDAIPPRTCEGCESLGTLELPESLLRINQRAFGGCRSLGTVTIPRSVTRIGHGAFQGCESLSEVKMPERLTSIEECVFAACRSLERIVLGDMVACIGPYAFADCVSLRSVTLPASLTHIHECAFAGCTGLVAVQLPAGLTYLGHYAFANCGRLSNVELPPSLNFLGDSAFKGSWVACPPRAFGRQCRRR